jgi:hypothetical protein
MQLRLQIGDAFTEEGAVRGRAPRDDFARVFELRPQGRRPLISRRCDLERIGVRRRSRERAAGAFDPAGFGQKSRQVIRIEGQGRLDRFALRLNVSALSAGRAQRHQNAQIMRRGSLRLAKQLTRAHGVPALKRSHAEPIKRLHMCWLALLHLEPGALRLLPATSIGELARGSNELVDVALHALQRSRTLRRRQRSTR